jgi:hypothetical protein
MPGSKDNQKLGELGLIYPKLSSSAVSKSAMVTNGAVVAEVEGNVDELELYDFVELVT